MLCVLSSSCDFVCVVSETTEKHVTGSTVSLCSCCLVCHVSVVWFADLVYCVCCCFNPQQCHRLNHVAFLFVDALLCFCCYFVQSVVLSLSFCVFTNRHMSPEEPFCFLVVGVLWLLCCCVLYVLNVYLNRLCVCNNKKSYWLKTLIFI